MNRRSSQTLEALALLVFFIAGAVLGVLLVWWQYGMWRDAGFTSGWQAQTPDAWYPAFIVGVGFLTFLVCGFCVFHVLFYDLGPGRRRKNAAFTSAAHDRNLPPLAIWAPFVFGCLGLLFALAYHAQGSGAVLRSSYPLGLFIQRHPNTFGVWSSLYSIFGVLTGLVVRRFDRRQAVTAGILVSFTALLLSL